ncbi:hypothetical protein BJ742DRAFT_831821 [Cladochytrium replicatum]|nr:hypothetical protein BJ742DRAFT_831821 [Cladochytrium replicatum]
MSMRSQQQAAAVDVHVDLNTPKKSPATDKPTTVEYISEVLKKADFLAPLSLFIALHGVGDLLIRRTLSPADIAALKLKNSDILNIAEKLPSTLAALLVSIPAIRLVHFTEAFKGDVFTSYPPEGDRGLGIYLAFTLYDVWVFAVRGREHISSWIHHVLGLLGAALERQYKILAFNPIVALTSEITVPVSNLLWLMQRLHMVEKYPRVYYTALILRAVLFTIFRAPNFIYMVSQMILQTNEDTLRRVNQAVGINESVDISANGGGMSSPNGGGSKKKPLSLKDRLRLISLAFKRLPFIVVFLSILNVSAFGVLNAYWTTLVFKALTRFRNTKAFTAAF